MVKRERGRSLKLLSGLTNERRVRVGDVMHACYWRPCVHFSRDGAGMCQSGI